MELQSAGRWLISITIFVWGVTISVPWKYYKGTFVELKVE